MDIQNSINEINHKLNLIFDQMESDIANDESIGLHEFHYRFNEIQFARVDFKNAVEMVGFLLTFDDDPDEIEPSN